MLPGDSKSKTHSHSHRRKLEPDSENAKLSAAILRFTGTSTRKQHLNHHLEAARERQDEEVEWKVLQIMQREKERAFWRPLNWALGKKRGSGVAAVQVSDGGGGHVRLKTQEEIQQAIWSHVHLSRYHMAEEAPICQGKLRGEFGYNADTMAA